MDFYQKFFLGNLIFTVIGFLVPLCFYQKLNGGKILQCLVALAQVCVGSLVPEQCLLIMKYLVIVAGLLSVF